ncbi:OmpP1/FadL family transporter [Nitrosophilus alvini]|uniref:OmpP1/FadL family transporter n=1 Tax=Nitrosophilus alvini TaxID=2714855 RepID=UPI00190C1CC7|nr:outer membrane protein transport protein [Nitrosophilus alvini]
MKKKIQLSAALLLCASSLFGAAYKIPEQSTKSIALGAAYVAGAEDADASYFNPANMSFMSDGAKFEGGVTFIYLPKIEFKGTVAGAPADAKSKSEKFLLPYFHYVSPAKGNLRFGLSFTEPAGLSKKWTDTIQKWSAEEFTLRVFELNPTVSYKISDTMSFGAGIRAIYSDGKVKIVRDGLYQEDLEGNTDIKLGYNLALTIKPVQNVTLAATYRSRVTLKEKGSAKGYVNLALIGLSGIHNYDTNADVSVPLPATLAVAAAYDIDETTKAEVVYERTFWSRYRTLDFNFDDQYAEAILGQPKPKNWEDSSTIRVGLRHLHAALPITTFASIAYDETPVPAKYVGFELPDSDAIIASIGMQYKVNEQFDFGAAYLYDYKKKRTITAADANINGIVGEFSKGGAHLVNISLNYRF